MTKDEQAELESLRKFRDELQGLAEHSIRYYTAKGQHTNVTPNINLSGARHILRLCDDFLGKPEIKEPEIKNRQAGAQAHSVMKHLPGRD